MRQSIGGHPVEVDVLGDGLSVLLLHGFGADRRRLLATVDPVFARRSGYRRIHVDLPGFGASPSVPEIDSSVAMVDFVERLIDELIGDAPFLVVGESWGAYLGRGLTCRRPLQIIGAAFLVPVVIALQAERHVPEHRVLYEEPGVLDGVPEATAAEIRAVGVVIDKPAWTHYRAAFLPPPAPDADAMARIRAGYTFPDDVNTRSDPFPHPTLIVAGRQDATVGYRDAITVIEAFPRATFAVLDAAGHLLPGERPSLLAALLDDWLDRVERSRD